MDNMISGFKNIVFDMGDVLIDYDADNVTRIYTGDEAVIREIHAVVFCSSEWHKLDAGLIEENVAEERWLPRLSSDKVREVARLAFRDWHLYNMRPKPGMADIIRGLKSEGKGIYILSNAGIRLPEVYRKVMPVPELYDGVFFSAEYQCVKPQDIIYLRFFEKFGLKPEECFFIDDMPENVEMSQKLGMQAMVFDGNVEALSEAFGFSQK